MSDRGAGTVQIQREDGSWEKLGELQPNPQVEFVSIVGSGDEPPLRVVFTHGRTVLYWTWPPDAETLRGIQKRRWAERYRRRYKRRRGQL